MVTYMITTSDIQMDGARSLAPEFGEQGWIWDLFPTLKCQQASTKISLF
jgi:hypothetical protein